MPLLSVTFTVAPAVCPCCASNVAVSTLNSCTAPAGGTNATRRPLAMLGEPSSVNSLRPGPPSAVKSDVPPLSKGRENFRSPWYATPGARRARTKGFPSESGISAILLLVDHLPRRTGASFEQRRFGGHRHGLLEIADLEDQRQLEPVADSDLDAIARCLLETGQLHDELVASGRQVGNRKAAVGCRSSP